MNRRWKNWAKSVGGKSAEGRNGRKSLSSVGARLETPVVEGTGKRGWKGGFEGKMETEKIEVVRQCADAGLRALVSDLSTPEVVVVTWNGGSAPVEMLNRHLDVVNFMQHEL